MLTETCPVDVVPLIHATSAPERLGAVARPANHPDEPSRVIATGVLHPAAVCVAAVTAVALLSYQPPYSVVPFAVRPRSIGFDTFSTACCGVHPPPGAMELVRI